MNKKFLSALIFSGLFCFAGFVLADSASIEPFTSATTFCGLLTMIGDKVGLLIASLGTIMIIVAGIFYLTSAGNPQRMETAKKALFYAIAGIVIGISAKAIVGIIKEIISASGGSCS